MKISPACRIETENLEGERERSDLGFAAGGAVGERRAWLSPLFFAPAFARRYFLPGAGLVGIVVAAYYCVTFAGVSRRRLAGARGCGNAVLNVADSTAVLNVADSTAVWDAMPLFLFVTTVRLHY